MNSLYALMLLWVSPSLEKGSGATSSSTVTPVSVVSTAVRYELIEEPGALYVLTKPSSALGFLAHEHVVEARAYRGHVVYDPARPHTCTVELKVPVSRLVVDRADMRAQLEISKAISDKDRAKVGKNMRAKKQLYQDKYTHIHFSASGCDAQEKAGEFIVDASLEIRGVAYKLQIPVFVQFLEDELTIRSDFSANHESFGFKPYSAFGGMIKNDSELRFRVRLRARRSHSKDHSRH